jgi:hypothetical protein
MAGSHQIWELDLRTTDLMAVAGSGGEGTRNGAGEAATLAQPSGLALDDEGFLFFADSESSSIRTVNTRSATYSVRTAAGSQSSLFDFGDVDGVGTDARFQHPLGVAFHEGLLYVADTYNSKIKTLDPSTGEVKSFLGGEQGWRDGEEPLFYEPGGLDAAEGKIYVADTNNHSVRIIDLVSGETGTLVLKGVEDFLGDDNFLGNTVYLEGITVGSGKGRLVLNIELPAGYKLNEEAPSSVSWKAEQISLIEPTVRIEEPFPNGWEADFSAGEGTLVGDINLVYCEKERESVCLLESVRIVVPITVEDGGESVLTVEHRVDLPDLPDSTLVLPADG